MGAYVIIALNFIFINIISEIKNKYLKKVAFCIVMVLFFGVAGLSYKIHNDFYYYESLYNNISEIDPFKVGLEYGFIYLNIIFSNFLNFNLFKAIVYFIDVVLINKGLKNLLSTKQLIICVTLLYFYGPFYMYFLSSFRQAIAISIFIYTIKYIVLDKKYNTYKYIFFNILGIFFHKSLLLSLPVYFFIKYYRVTKFKTLFYFILMLVINFFNGIPIKIIEVILKVLGNIIPKIEERSRYFTIISTNEVSVSLTIYVLLYGVIIFYYFNKNLKLHKWKINGYTLFTFVVILGNKIPIMYRVTPIFSIFFVLILIDLINYFNSKLFKYSVLLVFLLNYNLKLIYLENKFDKRYIPYHSYIEFFYRKINYKETAQYNHVIELYGTEIPDLSSIGLE